MVAGDTPLAAYLVRPSVFERPHRTTAALHWRGHIPFAFWCVDLLRPSVFVELGTYRGDSYCAFCQAVALLAAPTRCVAVDTWRGDIHMGPYDDHVFEDLRAHHEPRYGRFSRLVRSTFDEAAGRFADGSVDLLHHDGAHTYEALVHDFDVWLPKMSPHGVMLIHDVEARLPGFGAWRFWQEVSAAYPSFAFRHSFGLGVLGVGRDVPEPIRRLTECVNADRTLVRAFFEALGERLVCGSECERLAGELKGMLKSRSWRMTAPLRWTRRRWSSPRA